MENKRPCLSLPPTRAKQCQLFVSSGSLWNRNLLELILIQVAHWYECSLWPQHPSYEEDWTQSSLGFPITKPILQNSLQTPSSIQNNPHFSNIFIDEYHDQSILYHHPCTSRCCTRRSSSPATSLWCRPPPPGTRCVRPPPPPSGVRLKSER